MIENTEVTPEELQAALEEVTQKDPMTLYRVLNAFRFKDMSGPIVEIMKPVYAHYIKMVYLDTGRLAPAEEADLISEIGDYAASHLTIEDEAEEVLKQVFYKSYIEIHDLQWVMDEIDAFTSEEDDDLDREFIYAVHTQGLDFPSDPEALSQVYLQWLHHHMIFPA